MFFGNIPEEKRDPVFGILESFGRDERPSKINLVVGTYFNEDLELEELSSVKKARHHLAKQDLSVDYLPQDGAEAFCDSLGRLAFGETLWKDYSSCTYKAQALGGTGALRLGAELFSRFVTQEIYIPNLTWPNHYSVFTRGGLKVGTYPYYDPTTRSVDCDALCHALMELPHKSAVLLHASCHNPSGRDPTLPQWKQIFSCMQKRGLIPFFDCPYQGFGFGIDLDMQAPRLWMQYGEEMMVAYSCSKNFSLYNERVGALFVVTQTPAVKYRIESQVRQLIRAMYSNPPATGERIVTEVLQDPKLFQDWQKGVDQMRHRLLSMRAQCVNGLVSRAKRTDFRYLAGQLGFFLATELTKEHVDLLIKEHAIYMLGSGRLNLAGLNSKNIETVIDAILSVCES